MKVFWKITLGVLVTFSLLLCLPPAWGETAGGEPGAPESQPKDLSVPENPATDVGTPESPATDLSISESGRINAIVYPVRSATVGTEVRGIVDVLKFQEGEPVEKGSVVTEVSKARYEAIVGEFKGNYDAVARTLELARKELKVQDEIYEKRSNTYQDLLNARYQVKILESRKQEAEFKLKQAELNLKACVIKAPFDGTIAVLYREPFETVDYLEKIFEVIDTGKVYARANWPESRLSEVSIGKKAVFNYKGVDYEGEIAKISSLIDPISKSKLVHILINNSDKNLQVGMSGTVSLQGSEKVSMADGELRNN
jgi:RND family efflux transporter MFP subunit